MCYYYFMSKSLLNLQTNTRMYLDEATEADFLDTEVTMSINYGYQDVAGHVMEVKEEYFQTTTPFTYATVANQQEYSIDSSLVKVNRVEINLSPNQANSQALKAVPVKMNEMLINLSNTSTVNFIGNVGYYLHGSQATQKLGFIPYPTITDTAPTKSISVWGIALPSDLVNTTDSVDLPFADRFSYLIALHAASHLLSKGQQDERSATKYMAMYNQGVMDMKNFLATRQEDGVEMVQDAYLENTDFGFPL